MLEPVWSNLRADTVRRELSALERAGLDVGELQTAAAEIVHRVVPYDATCWATVDPDSNVLTTSVTLQFDPSPELETRFAEIEAAGDDLNTFRRLVGSRTSVARLSDAGLDAIEASPRLADIYAPLGFGRELRAMFSIDTRCWGVAGLLRGTGSADFSDDEVAFLGSVSSLIAGGIRTAVLSSRANELVELGSAVLVVSNSGAILAATPQAEERLAALDGSGRTSLALALRSVVAAVRLQRVAHARARLRDATGAWITITASPLRSANEEHQIAVTIEPTLTADLTDLLLTAHGLTAREREICAQVLAGKSTSQISASLYISANTVQDHLKSVFGKTGVRSRRELVAWLSNERAVGSGPDV
jgi:DNA-binding CsgD family transcriptional regulator